MKNPIQLCKFKIANLSSKKAARSFISLYTFVDTKVNNSFVFATQSYTTVLHTAPFEFVMTYNKYRVVLPPWQRCARLPTRQLAGRGSLQHCVSDEDDRGSGSGDIGRGADRIYLIHSTQADQ